MEMYGNGVGTGELYIQVQQRQIQPDLLLVLCVRLGAGVGVIVRQGLVQLKGAIIIPTPGTIIAVFA